MSYQEFSPPPALAKHVRLIWQFEGAADSAASPVQRIVADGHPELILHFGDPYAEVDAQGNAVTQVHALFAGQLTRPLLLRPAARPGVLGVRFFPAAARAFFSLPMQTLRDRRVALAALWGEDATHSVMAGLLQAQDGAARVAHVAGVLRARLAQSTSPSDAGIARGAQRLLADDARIALDELALACKLSRRQFERTFLTEVGVSPRLFASIVRFRKLFDALEQQTLRVRHWAEAAHFAGYFDQAHMNRDFKRFAGLAPQAFCKTLGGLSAAMVGAAPP